jgi:glycosyltransferase involved in cell wall biosynthesis
MFCDFIGVYFLMQIALVIDDYLPDSQKSGAQLMHDLACCLKQAGHDVLVITPSPGLIENYKKDCLDGVSIYRFKSGPTKNINKIHRAVNETLLSWRAIWNLNAEFRKKSFDLVVYYSPSIFWGGLIFYLKKIWKCKSYLILRDIFPQWAIDGGLINKNSPICWYFKFFETISYAVADIIGIQTVGNKVYFKGNLSKNKRKIEVLYNWASERKKSFSQSIWREKLKLQDKIVFFFGGNLGHAQDMNNIVRLAANLRGNADAHFLLVGKGDEVGLIEQEIQALNLNNITLHPAVPSEIYFQMLSEFDVGLFSLNKNHNTCNVPGKLLGYMDYQLPILGSVNFGNDVKEIIEGYKAGLVTVNGDDAGFLQNALLLLQNPLLRSEFGKNGKHLLKEVFSAERTCKQIVDSVNHMNSYNR